MANVYAIGVEPHVSDGHVTLIDETGDTHNIDVQAVAYGYIEIDTTAFRTFCDNEGMSIGEREELYSIIEFNTRSE